jgi:hypothetical protein
MVEAYSLLVLELAMQRYRGRVTPFLFLIFSRLWIDKDNMYKDQFFHCMLNQDNSDIPSSLREAFKALRLRKRRLCTSLPQAAEPQPGHGLVMLEVNAGQ